MSLPLWESLKWQLQDGSIGNLAALYLEEKKITLDANSFLQSRVFTQVSEFLDFLYKIMDLATMEPVFPHGIGSQELSNICML